MCLDTLGCKFETGHVAGVKEFEIKDAETPKQCAIKCLAKRREEYYRDINGITVDSATGKNCYCERSATTRQSGRSEYKGCFFDLGK